MLQLNAFVSCDDELTTVMFVTAPGKNRVRRSRFIRWAHHWGKEPVNLNRSRWTLEGGSEDILVFEAPSSMALTDVQEFADKLKLTTDTSLNDNEGTVVQFDKP